jgi:23S rRNA pseudouridine1911/1915/1917 synthase
MRVDRYVADILGAVTRSQLKARDAEILVNGKPAKLSKPVHLDDVVTLRLPPAPAVSLEPEAMHLDVLYEDERMIAVNKAAGMVVHPGHGHPTHTLIHGIMHHVAVMQERFTDEPVRPGIVHRLDKDTSGVIVLAKDPEAHEILARQFRDRTVRKLYLALVHGTLRPATGVVQGRIHRDPRNRKRFTLDGADPGSRPGGRLGDSEGDARRVGKESFTRYRTLRRWGHYACVALLPRTGRTHQLRVHMQYLGSPILGDPLYARRDHRFPDLRLMLHARWLRIRPPGHAEPITLSAPIPKDLRGVVDELNGGSSPT